MKNQTSRRIVATGLMAGLLITAGCAMPPWRAKQTAQRAVQEDYIERTSANIQYGTDGAAPGSMQNAATDAFRSPASLPASRSASSGSGGSCCH